MTIFRPILCSALLCATALPVSADRLAPEWQAQRDFYNGLADRACAGDRAALEYLGADSWDSVEPVAMNALAWVIRPDTSCAGVQHDREAWLELIRASATEFYYPPAMANWGYILVTGRLGLPQDRGEGIHWLQNAMDEGLSSAAADLAAIHAEGRFGVEQDIGAAEFYYRRAEQLGLPADWLSALADLIDAAAEGDAAPPAAPAPVAAGGGGGGGGANGAPVEVAMVNGRVGANVPRLGDVQNMGGWVDRTVYVAQRFDRQGGCWTTGGGFMVGEARENIDPDAAHTLPELLELSNQARAEGRDARHVTNFSSLGDGIAFVTANPSQVDSTGQPPMWSLAAAQAYGPRCPNNDYAEVTYPEPVFAPGY